MVEKILILFGSKNIILEVLGIKFNKVWCDNEWLESVGRLPRDLKEVEVID